MAREFENRSSPIVFPEDFSEALRQLEAIPPPRRWLYRAVLRVLRQPSALWTVNWIRGVLFALRTIPREGYDVWQVGRWACWSAGAIQLRSEFTRLLGLVKRAEPRCVLEIGCAGGGTMCAWARISAPCAKLVGVDLHRDARLRDLPPENEVERRIRAVLKLTQTLNLVWGDSHSHEVKRRVLEALKGQAVDFLFIDGDHSYEGVRRDFEDYAPLVRDGGLIAFHDIVPDFEARYGVTTGVSWSGEVPNFWEEISSQYRNITLVENPAQDGAGIGVITYSHRHAGARG